MRSTGIEFRTEGSSVLCLRYKVSPRHGRADEKVVASFDVAVDRVAPHVAAVLTAPERQRLQHWLSDRHTLQQGLRHEPLENTVLESLPALLDEAISAAASAEDMDIATYQLIKRKLTTLERMLDNVESQSQPDKLELKVMNDEEVLKEQLRTIKRRL